MGRPAKRTSETRMREIIAAARDLFSQAGYDSVSVHRIAEQAGVSAGLIYYFFPRKEDLLVAVIEDAFALHRDIFNEVRTHPDPLDQFDCVVRRIYRAMDRRSAIVRIVYHDLRFLDKARRQQVTALHHEAVRQITAIIERGQATGRFRPQVPARVLAYDVMGLGHLWVLQHRWSFGPEWTVDDYIARQLAIFHGALGVADLALG